MEINGLDVSIFLERIENAHSPIQLDMEFKHLMEFSFKSGCLFGRTSIPNSGYESLKFTSYEIYTRFLPPL